MFSRIDYIFALEICKYAFLLQLISSHSFCADRERLDGIGVHRRPVLGVEHVDGLCPCGVLHQDAGDPPFDFLPHHWLPEAEGEEGGSLPHRFLQCQRLPDRRHLSCQ